MEFLIGVAILIITFVATFLFGIFYYVLVPIMGVYLIIMGIPTLKEIYRLTRNPEKEKIGIKKFFVTLVFLPFIILRSREIYTNFGDALTVYYSVLLVLTLLVPNYIMIFKRFINYLYEVMNVVRAVFKKLFEAYFK